MFLLLLTQMNTNEAQLWSSTNLELGHRKIPTYYSSHMSNNLINLIISAKEEEAL